MANNEVWLLNVILLINKSTYLRFGLICVLLLIILLLKNKDKICELYTNINIDTSVYFIAFSIYDIIITYMIICHCNWPHVV